MSAFTFKLPDQKYEKLKQYAKSQNISVNRLLDELTTAALASYDAKNRFETRATKGNPQKGLDILEKLRD